MILADTCVWVDHIRKADPRLSLLLANDQLLGHPFVTGEVACGSLARRSLTLTLLAELPSAVLAHDDEAMELMARQGLMGIGIGYIDVHLLAATLLTHGATLWTRDKRLAAAATRLGVAA